MVGGEIFSAPQRPENLQNRRQPRHRPSLVIGRITRRKPVMDARECLPEKGKIRLGGVQMLGPATERRRIGRPIRVLERRRRLFPRVVLHKAPPQCLTASQQAVLGVRERKQRQEGEGLSATVAATAPDLDPIMVFIVRLFAAVSMADNRIAFTSGASPQDDFGAARGPIRFTLVRRDRKWDKQNRSSLELCPPALTRPRSRPEAELLPPEAKNPTGREYSFSPMTF